jgi:hypothetical protein
MWLSSDSTVAKPSYARTAEPHGGCLDIFVEAPMSAVLQEPEIHHDEERDAAVRLAEVRGQDEYWQRRFQREHYFRGGLEYEDYAPAYCVGYAGHAQYGGSFEDAERSLLANWERIKGDSRLALEDAVPAMRAAWDRMEMAGHSVPAVLDVGAFRRAVKFPSFNPVVAVAR